ncbi:MAG: M36 family metallopeptidase [Blastocatellia bacterium]
MAKIKGLKAKVENHPQYNVPRQIRDIEMKASKSDPAKIAETMLKKIAPDLKINPDLSQLKFDKVKETILGSHVLYQQYYEGKPISGAWIRVDIDKEGKVYNILNDLIPAPVISKTKKAEEKFGLEGVAAEPLSAEEAKKRALEATPPPPGGQNEVLDSELVYYPHNGIPTLAWKVIVKTTFPKAEELKGQRPAEWKFYLDAETGAILDKENLLKFVNGKGKVFDPHPVATLNDTDLEDSSTIPASAYTEVVLNDLKNTGMLDGPFVTTSKTTSRVKRTNHDFRFTREKRAFKEVMVYFHIDRVQRHIQELGFNNVLNHPIAVSIDGESDDNSHYSPSDKDLTFGTGGVDDAEDAEIILHEYGHAIQDDQVPGFGASQQAAAMGEGFGDFLAASFFADVKPQQMRPTIGNWDATFYSGAEPPCLRRLDSNKKFPKDMNGEVHDDGEIWSACLWEMRNAIGRRTTEILVIAHHFLLSRRASFEDAAKALITADKNLNQGSNEKAIRDIFVRRGILPNPKRNNKRAGEPFEAISRAVKGE